MKPRLSQVFMPAGKLPNLIDVSYTVVRPLVQALQYAIACSLRDFVSAANVCFRKRAISDFDTVAMARKWRNTNEKR